MHELIVFLIKIFIFITFLHLIGATANFFSRIKFQRPFLQVFLQQLTGLSILIIGTAIYFTGGKTIFLGLIFFAAIFLFQNKPEKFELIFFHFKQRLFPQGKIALYLFLGIIVIFLLDYFHFRPKPGTINLPYWDTIFYSKISFYLSGFGKETYDLEYLYPDLARIKPYHYMDLWVNAGVTKIFGGLHITNLMTVTYPYGLWLTWLGFLALGESILKKTNLLLVVLSFLALFFVGLKPTFLTQINIFKDIAFLDSNAWAYSKLLPIYWFLIPFFIFLFEKKTITAIFFISVLPLVYFTTLPAVAGVLLVWIIILICNKEIRNIFKILPGILLLGFVLVFYLFINKSGGENVAGFYLSQLADVGYWITFVNILGKTTIQIFVLFSPVIILTILYLLKRGKFSIREGMIENRLFFIFSTAIFVFSLTGWGLLNTVHDSMQLFSNINSSLMAILFFSFTIMLIREKGKSKYFALVLFVVFTVPGLGKAISGEKHLKNQSIIDQKSLQATASLIKNKNPIGVFFMSSDDYTSLYLKSPTVYTLGQELSLISSEIHLVSLSVFEMPYNENERFQNIEKQYLQNSTFYRFVELQKENGSFVSIEQSQLDFIISNEIDFVVCQSDYQLPNEIIRLVAKPINLQNGDELLYLLDR